MVEQENFVELERIERLDKGKYKLYFSNGNSIWVYSYEVRKMHLQEGSFLSEKEYQYIYNELVGKRAKKRALHLLERMDRTEQQLRDKLLASDYPRECVEDAIEYVKRFRYIDDQRYAETFTRYKKEKMSRHQIRQKLMQKGVSKETVAHAIEDEYDVDESEHIRKLLEKKRFAENHKNEGEARRVYNFLLRRGFRSNDILREMKSMETDWD